MGFLAAAAPYAGALIGAAGSAIGGAIGSNQNQETKLQRQRRKLVDELLGSLRSGSGVFSDLFNPSEEAFQKGFVDPAMSRFNNQIAPGIQQQFVNSGLQRGTGLDDALSRAGVDLNNMINENYLTFHENALNRKQNLLQGILQGGNNEAGSQMSAGQGALQGLAGYTASPGFSNTLESLFGNTNQNIPKRTGYNNDWVSGGAGAAGNVY